VLYGFFMIMGVSVTELMMTRGMPAELQ